MNKLFSVFFLSTCLIYASDSRLHLIHADKTTGQLINGERVRILSGNVEAYQDTINIWCDEAIFFEVQNKANFMGNVILDDGHRRLWCKKIIYYADTRTANCTGNVRIGGQNDSLYAQTFIYNFREKNAEGKKNLFLWDKQNNARVWGDYGKYLSATHQSFIEGNARFEHSESSEKDTMVITSKFLQYHGMVPKKAIALDSVTIVQGELKATCDSATYFATEERVWLRVNPFAWQTGREMKGKRIDIELDSLKVKEIFLYDKAEMKSLVDSLENKYDILRGKSIQVSVKDKKPQKIIARNNAIGVYAIEDNGEKQGTNSASSDSIIIFFKTGEMDSISIIGGSEGIFYPADYKGEIKVEP